MFESPSILLYGHDATLLTTRCLILKKSGLRIWIAWDLPGIETIISNQHINLFILCQTVSQQDRTKAEVLVKSLNPNVVSFRLMELLPLQGGQVYSKNVTGFIADSTFISAITEVIRQHVITSESTDQS